MKETMTEIWGSLGVRFWISAGNERDFSDSIFSAKQGYNIRYSPNKFIQYVKNVGNENAYSFH